MFFLSLFLQHSLSQTFASKDEQARWEQIDSLESEENYSAALELSEEMLHEAKQNGDRAAQVKATLYLVKYIELVNEESYLDDVY